MYSRRNKITQIQLFACWCKKRIGTYSVVSPSAFAESYRTLPSVWQIKSEELGCVSISFNCWCADPESGRYDTCLPSGQSPSDVNVWRFPYYLSLTLVADPPIILSCRGGGAYFRRPFVLAAIFGQCFLIRLSVVQSTLAALPAPEGTAPPVASDAPFALAALLRSNR